MPPVVVTGEERVMVDARKSVPPETWSGTETGTASVRQPAAI